uniref:Secreted RxLR effector protein 45 n=1 Tax=Plasmopara viticola TaxID=143451 RepID=RLR45_PLAVT|nr:RecName: Full=Secreted RxLR effector protein 45; Flags: Precursor [Plasmopara viticola]
MSIFIFISLVLGLAHQHKRSSIIVRLYSKDGFQKCSLTIRAVSAYALACKLQLEHRPLRAQRLRQIRLAQKSRVFPFIFYQCPHKKKSARIHALTFTKEAELSKLSIETLRCIHLQLISCTRSPVVTNSSY